MRVPEYLLEDCVQEGLVAAWEAECAFDANRGVPREAYIAQRVRWAVQQALRDADPMPARLRADYRRILAAESGLLNQQVKPTDHRIAECCGLSVQRVR